jgi:subtilase family serine protease
MIPDRVLRFIWTLFLSTLGIFVLCQPAMAAKPHRAMSPAGVIGPQATPVETPTGVAGPLYGLFTCQVVGLSPSQTCYDPYQMRHAYQTDLLINAGYDGSGQTIVIVDAFQSPHLAANPAFFNNFYGLPAASLTQIAPDGLTPFITGDPNMTGWAEEITLDVLWAHAIAPGAHIVLVLAKSNQDADILSALKYAVDHNLGDVISMSFGENESCVDPTILAGYHDVFAAATQKNITLFASSGDDGAAQMTCDGTSWAKAVSSPASDPLVAGVGGTELHAARYCLASQGCDPNTHPLPGTWQGEIVWNEFGSISTGGGFKRSVRQPPYQAPSMAGSSEAYPTSRNAAVLHGVLTYLDIPGYGLVYLFGGTSAGSPTGPLSPRCESEAAKRLVPQFGLLQDRQDDTAYPASFHDITSGNNSVVEDAVSITGFAAGIGWDATTGFGTPISSSLVDYLIATVSPGDGTAAIATTKPKPHPKPIVPGTMGPH